MSKRSHLLPSPIRSGATRAPSLSLPERHPLPLGSSRWREHWFSLSFQGHLSWRSSHPLIFWDFAEVILFACSGNYRYIQSNRVLILIGILRRIQVNMTSVGQINNELARQIYQHAGRTADALVRAGKIAASDRNATWARLAAEKLARYKLQVPKAVAAQAGPRTIQNAVVSTPSVAGAVAKATAGQTATAVLRGGAPVAAAIFLLETGYAGYKYLNDEIDGGEFGRRAAESAATNCGGLGGAAVGAAIGSVVPGVGTLIGAVIGGVAGSAGASKLVRFVSR
jgi:hypothetical protein